MRSLYHAKLIHFSTADVAFSFLNVESILMRKLIMVVGAALVAFLVFCGDSEACGRGRHRHRCETCCESQSWVRCFDPSRYHGCLSGVCWCCDAGGNWVTAGCGGNCDACLPEGKRPVAGCAYYGDGKTTATCPCGGHGHLLCAMICDPCTHVMRFALPWEQEDGYYALRFLGAPCHPSTATPPKS